MREAYEVRVQGRVEPIKVPLGYQLALAAVAVALVLLPLVYLALTAAAAAGTVWYAVTVWPQLHTIRGGSSKLIALAGPPIAGVILVYFMLRSMWPRRRQEIEGLVVDAGLAPNLHRLVEGIADALGAPRPREIRVDLEVNASAALRRGALSLFRRDLVLTVGLPLVAGLDTRQLAGVVAHELGHFAQRGGMGVSYLIRSINGWFGRVVHERTDIDAGLERQAEEGYWGARLIAWIARMFLWLSRKLLAGLMYVAAALSAAFSRQMEYDADRYEARLVGASTAIETLAELTRLHVASQGAWSEAATHWRDGKLADDLPALILDHRQRFGPELLQSLAEIDAGAMRPWYASHPSARERAASLANEPRGGILADTRPARELFANFEGICREASIAEYRMRLGAEFSTERLIDLGAVAAERDRARAESKAFVRAFGVTLSRHRPVPIDPYAAAESERSQAREELERLTVDSRTQLAEIQASNRRYAELELRLDLLESISELEEVGVDEVDWGTKEEVAEALGGSTDVSGAIVLARSEQERLGAILAASDRRAGRRLALALALEGSGTTEPDKSVEAAALVRALRELDEALPRVQTLRRNLTALQALWGRLEGRRKQTRFVERLESKYSDVRKSLDRLHVALYPFANPLSSDSRTATLQRFVLPTVPDPGEAAATAATADDAIDRFVEIRIRVLSRLVTLAGSELGEVCDVEPEQEGPDVATA